MSKSIKITQGEYDHLNCRVGQAKQILRTCARIKDGRRSVMIWGGPGIGKTSVCRQFGEEEEFGFDSTIVFTPSQDDVIDWKFPYLEEVKFTRDGKQYKEKISKFAISDRIPKTGKHLIVVDEINTASMSLQPTLYSLMLEHRVAGHDLPAGCMCVGTGNRETDNCAAQPMSAALKDRMAVHMNLIPDVETWTAWAAHKKLHPSVMSYVRDIPAALEGFDAEDPTSGCTPRSLESLSHLVEAGIEESCEFIVYQGCIGRARGMEFDAHMKIFRNQIPIEEILANPETARLPDLDKPDMLFILSTTLAAYCTKLNFDKLFRYSERLPKTYQFLFVQDAFNRDKTMKSHPGFLKYVGKNHNLLLDTGKY